MSTKPVRIVLVRPEIPPNVGNVARTCVGLGLPLTLAGPVSFDLSESRVRRAGLDYWPRLDLTLQPDEEALIEQLDQAGPVLLSSKADSLLWEIDLTRASALIFGSETKGLPDRWRQTGWPTAALPQHTDFRCYNLSNSVAAAAMEWARQNRWLCDDDPA